MNITTKYDRGQEVFVEFGRELMPAIIKDIRIEVTKAEGTNDVVIKTMYSVWMGGGQSASGEDYIHNSPEEFEQVRTARKAAKIERLQAKIAALLGE